MANEIKTYRRMPSTTLGTILRWFDRSTAWLADDHVLVTKRILWLERYNRIYFSDIQAVAICRTQTGLVWNILFGTGAGLLALGAVLNGFPTIVMVWLAIFAIPLLVNIGLGPTCSCHAYTAVNDHTLPCFNRLPKAMVFLETIRPLVAEIQGEVSNEELVDRAPLIPPVRRTAPGVPRPTRVRHYDGGVHMVLLSLLLVGAVLSGLQLLVGASAIGWLTAIFLIAQFGMSIAAAARQAGTDIPSGLRNVTWLAFGQVFVIPVLFIIAGVVAVEETSVTWLDDNTSAASTVSSADMMYLMINVGSMLFSAILCVTGRHILSAFRDNYRISRLARTTRTQPLGDREA